MQANRYVIMRSEIRQLGNGLYRTAAAAPAAAAAALLQHLAYKEVFGEATLLVHRSHSHSERGRSFLPSPRMSMDEGMDFKIDGDIDFFDQEQSGNKDKTKDKETGKDTDPKRGNDSSPSKLRTPKGPSGYCEICGDFFDDPPLSNKHHCVTCRREFDAARKDAIAQGTLDAFNAKCATIEGKREHVKEFSHECPTKGAGCARDVFPHWARVQQEVYQEDEHREYEKEKWMDNVDCGWNIILAV